MTRFLFQCCRRVWRFTHRLLAGIGAWLIRPALLVRDLCLRSRVRRSIRRLLVWVWMWLHWPGRLIYGLSLRTGERLRAWWRTRKLQQLLAGLPALLVACGAFYIGLAAVSQDRGRVRGAYQRAAKAALADKQFAAATLYLERLLDEYPGDHESLFDLAQAAAETRDYPRLTATMQKLAPEDHPVHGPSHVWQARRLLTGTAVTPENLRLAEKHLNHALQLGESRELAHAILGEMYFRLGLWSQAIHHLEESRDRARRLLLAKAYALNGQGEKGRSAAEQARDHFAREATDHPQDPLFRVNWAEASLFLEQYPDAIRILREALAMGDQVAIRQALARSYAMWADSLAADEPSQRKQKFDLLALGVQAYPDEVLLYDRLLKLLESDQETSETVRKFLQTNIVEGRAIGLSHLILGSYAFVNGRVDEAKLHMERAFEILPNADIVANNLAWLMLHAEPPELERALSLIDPVIERNPRMPRFLDTRGQVLVKLQRHREAVRDLEQAVATLQNSIPTHEALAAAYDHLGLKELAELHLQAAADLRQGAGKNPP